MMAGTAQQARRMARELPLGRDAAAVRQRIEVMEKLLERTFTLPGTSQPFGLDAILSVIPVAGDAVGALMGLYLVWEARNLGMSKWQISRMLGNVGVDAAIGAVPLLGVVGDFLFRSNSRNLKIIRRHLDKHHPGTRIIEG
jgi:hypothetical protein